MQKQLEIITQELKEKSEEVNKKLIHQYRSVRRLAREKPEETVIISVLSGIAIGFLISKIINSGKNN
jgi:ElaB/YqjD/DUF883 family membrane-anchored ribosome-binding protein